MESINILYIDDRIDEILSEYLDTKYINSEFNISYQEYNFEPNEGFDKLIINPLISTANIIIIDSRLFENATSSSKKFSGEDFKIILRKYYPFIEVIVITQNEPTPDLGTISKYNVRTGMSGLEYYEHILPDILNHAIKRIHEYRNLSKVIEKNDNIEEYIKGKVISSLQGESAYDELTKSDIDALIDAFKTIQERLDE